MLDDQFSLVRFIEISKCVEYYKLAVDAVIDNVSVSFTVDGPQ